MFVRALKGKRPELSIPNLVHIYFITVAGHALTRRSKGQKSRSHGYEYRHGARLLVTMPVSCNPIRRCATCGRCRRGPWVSIRLTIFFSLYSGRVNYTLYITGSCSAVSLRMSTASSSSSPSVRRRRRTSVTVKSRS